MTIHQLEFRWQSYRLAYWSFMAFFVAPGIALFVLAAGAWCIDLGNNLFGSGTLNMRELLLATALFDHKGLVTICYLSSAAVGMTFDKNPLARIGAVVWCFAVHLILLGALA